MNRLNNINKHISFNEVTDYKPIYSLTDKMSILPRLKDKVCIVTGAARGFGQAIALKFIEEGAYVVCIDILDCKNTINLCHSIKGFNNSTDRILSIYCDITNKNDIKNMIKQVLNKFGNKIHVLVNNACKYIFKTVETATEDEWDIALSINIKGHALMTQACLPYMKYLSNKNGSGASIIFFSSLAGRAAMSSNVTYAVCKAANASLARNCAMDLAKYNIRCNAICPGTLYSPVVELECESKQMTYNEYSYEKTANVMSKRLGDPREIANAVVF